MSDPAFSIVIPTRERAATLSSALQSCLQQTFSDFEIVVCDNCSSSETRHVVENIASQKVVYHRSPVVLSMRDNWNLAYSLTRGKHIIYIGDDDSLMPFALRVLAQLFASEKIAAVRWDAAIYSWPNIARGDLADHLQIPLSRGCTRLEGRKAIQDVIARLEPATILPNVYHGCVERKLLEDIRARTGQVFESYHCDTYSAFTISYLAGEYLSLSYPLSVSGFSASSNNIAFNFLRGKHKNFATFRKENRSAGLNLHPFVPDLQTGFVCVADSFLRAKEDLFPEDPLSLDRRAMIESLIVAPPIDDVEEWPMVEDELRRAVSDDAALLSWFNERVRGLTPTPTPRDNYRPEFEGIGVGRIFLDAGKYGVVDVAGATRLAARLLGYNGKPLDWALGRAHAFDGLRENLLEKRIKLLMYFLRKSAS
jgi:hypothetical protein